MAHLQYMPGDPRLVDQLVYELKSKGIFDQFRKDCIADVDTRPAYQNLRQRVENSVSTFLTRQAWKPDLNKNQLRERLRKHILDGNYLEQGVERIVDQVVNPKVASVFIPQVEDLVYNYLGIARKKAPDAGTSEKKVEDLLPTDLEAVSPGSVKSNNDKEDAMDTETTEKMEVDEENTEVKEETVNVDVDKKEDIEVSEVIIASNGSESIDKSTIPLPAEEIKLESIPAPDNSPPKDSKVELENILLPLEPNVSTDIPLPNDEPKHETDTYFKSIQLQSEESSSSSGSSLRRNMSPLTPIRNFNNENSCDAQQGFDDNSNSKSEIKAAPSSFRFTIETNDAKSTENNSDNKTDKKETDVDLSYQFNNQVHINTFNTPMYDDSSNSNNLHIDYESDVNSKTNLEIKPEIENSQDSKKDKKNDDKKSTNKSSHRSRDSSRYSSSKDKRSDSKHSTSRDSSRHDKKSSSTRDDKHKSNKEAERSKDRNERKDSRDSSKNRSSHKSSYNKEKDSKSRRSSSSSHRHSSKSTDDKKSSSSKDKEKHSESSKDRSSKDKYRDSKSSSHRSDKDKKSSNSSSKKSDDKDKKKDKKDTDDHYSSSGRGNHSRRSTDRDSNDGSSSSKGSQQQNGSKSSESKKESKSTTSKSETTSTSGDSVSPNEKEIIVQDNSKISQFKPIVRVDNHLETPIAEPPRLPFVPDVTLKKPRFAANLKEAKTLMKMRKFLDDEQKRMNQEAALLLEFQANVRPCLSQVYSSIPGPELEFVCNSNVAQESVLYESVGDEQTVENNSADMEVANISKVLEASEVVESHDKKENTPGETINTQNNIEKEHNEAMEPVCIKPNNPESPEEPEKDENSYDENKPFSELMDEITEYSKASEIKTDVSEADNEEPHLGVEESIEKEEGIDIPEVESAVITESSDCIEYVDTKETTEIRGPKYFEVTIITEELSDLDDTDLTQEDKVLETKQEDSIQTPSLVTETESQKQSHDQDNTIQAETAEATKLPENDLQYFAEHEKYDAELERHEFSSFLKAYQENLCTMKKMYLINCDSYEENIVKESASTFGDFEVINYFKNGHLKLPNTSRNIVKDVKLAAEITLPLESRDYERKSPLFSPVKSECSFELCSDYETKLDDINKKSRQEVMEIILGSIIDTSPSKMPTIDYYMESVIDDEMDNTQVESETEDNVHTVVNETDNMLKRRIEEVESSENNNRTVLTSNKIRKMSDSDEISSTTEETEEVLNNNKVSNSTRSKYLGRARRVGLPRPKRSNITNSPSSDKSVENYVQNTPVTLPTPNGKIKTTPRAKIQRYDTSDLYKPKLHYLSRRNNVS